MTCANLQTLQAFGEPVAEIEFDDLSSDCCHDGTATSKFLIGEYYFIW